MAMAGANPFAIMKALGHADIQTTMIYVSLGKSHIRDQVDRLNCIPIPKSAYTPFCVSTRSSSKNVPPAA
jgi:integrase